MTTVTSNDAIAQMNQMQQDTMAVNLASQRLSSSQTTIGQVTTTLQAGNNVAFDVVKNVANDARAQAKQN